VLWLARFSGILAAIVWVLGTPLVAMAGVIPSDAEYFYIGLVCTLLGLALMPVITALRYRSSGRFTMAIRLCGLTICLALTASGALLMLAAAGKLGERAPEWIPGPSFIAAAVLFIWIGLASYALRGRSTVERAIFGLGVLTTASFLLPVAASFIVTYVIRGFVYTNATALPSLLLGILLWLSLPAWLTVIVLRLWPQASAHRTVTARPS
jgi:hypothetical protein